MQSTYSSSNSLDSLSRPPTKLLYKGPSFFAAKQHATNKNKWLLVNVQSVREFASHVLNRDLWTDEGIEYLIEMGFVFWQVYDNAVEGEKVSMFYHLNTFPAIMVIDPITGQKMSGWSSVQKADDLSMELLCYIDKGPVDSLLSVIAQSKKRIESSKMRGKDECVKISKLNINYSGNGDRDAENGGTSSKLKYPPLSEEPKKGCGASICSVIICFPDGRKVSRSFLESDRVKQLWSFCATLLDNDETRLFQFVRTVNGNQCFLCYDSELSFKEEDLPNTMLRLVWEGEC